MRSEVPCRDVHPELGRAGAATSSDERLLLDQLTRVASVYTSALRQRLASLPPEIALVLPLGVHVDPAAEPGAPRSWTWVVLTWNEDVWAQRFVDQHPEGAPLDVVGDALGLVKERVRQIEEEALRKLAAGRRGRRLAKLLEEPAKLRGEMRHG